MPWNPPENYSPKDGLEQILVNASTPSLTSPEASMLAYVTRRRAPQHMDVESAWAAIHVSPDHARKLIDAKMVPMEIYEKVKARALEDNA